MVFATDNSSALDMDTVTRVTDDSDTLSPEFGAIPTVETVDILQYMIYDEDYPEEDSMDAPDDLHDSSDIQYVSIFVISGIILLVLALSLLTLFLGRRFRVTKAQEELMKPSRMKAIWQNVTVITFRPTMIFNRSNANLAAMFGSKPPTPTDEENPEAQLFLRDPEAKAGFIIGPNHIEYAQVHPQITVTDTGEPDTRNNSLGDVYFDCHNHTPQVSRRGSQENNLDEDEEVLFLRLNGNT